MQNRAGQSLGVTASPQSPVAAHQQARSGIRSGRMHPRMCTHACVVTASRARARRDALAPTAAVRAGAGVLDGHAGTAAAADAAHAAGAAGVPHAAAGVRRRVRLPAGVPMPQHAGDEARRQPLFQRPAQRHHGCATCPAPAQDGSRSVGDV